MPIKASRSNGNGGCKKTSTVGLPLLSRKIPLNGMFWALVSGCLQVFRGAASFGGWEVCCLVRAVALGSLFSSLLGAGGMPILFLRFLATPH